MTISVLEAIEQHRYIYFGFESHPTEKEPWQATPIMAYSDNLVSWETISRFKELNGLRDGFLIKIEDRYYIIGTGGFYVTTDFYNFEKVDYLNGNPSYKQLWAPEIFKDTDGKYHIVYCAGDAEAGILNDYIADFDPQTNKITNENQTISFVDGAIDNSYRIDPDISLINGVYYLTIGGNYIFSSNNYLGPYQKFPVNFAPTPQKYSNHTSGIAGWLEGPNMFVDGNSIRLFADQTEGNGLVFRSATDDDMFNWTDTEKTRAAFKMRHGSILVNDKISAQVPAEFNHAPKFNSKITIKGIHTSKPVPLTCFLKSSFQVQYENNQTNQLQFVAYNDGSPAFSLIANESTIEFNDDLYIIKNIEQDRTGTSLYTVTAMQYVNSEIGRVFQKNIRSGTLTYTIEEVLDFFLNDETANPFGFSYHVFGDFPKQQIENLGGCSGKDMISKIISTWPGTIIKPSGMRVDVFSADQFLRNYQRRVVYNHDSTNMKLIEDSTVIVNQITCVGGSYSTDDSNGGTSVDGNADSTTTITEGEEQVESGQDNTAAFQADAKKYLGVPYVWGGHNKANPFAGMDCSGYVSQVYHDFGIEIPAYTVAMENNFREIPRSEIKPGDVGFYGPHGGTHHICLILDKNTQIYEPEPGQSCKTATIDSFPPDWYARNDEMQAKISTKKIESVPTESIKTVETYTGGSYIPETTTQQTHYYFQPFTLTDEHSKNEWGLHPASSILQDDRFKDPEAMKEYARTQFVLEPSVSIEIILNTNEMPIPGEQVYLTIPEVDDRTLLGETDTQHAYNTKVTLVGYTWYPYNPSQGTDNIYQNLPATLLHSQTSLTKLEQLANAMFDRIPQVFYGQHDPSANQAVKNGAIWVKPIVDQTTSSNNTDKDLTIGGET
ncbi:phage tail protein [Limosilactobacillus reuteri]|uniref:phage tail protein n=1 Tax=Limosilactobacillus reuteri TaxID=1598 RepID=UPI001C2BFB05|nr:phage tail protein [Limosilactobacillus reuteri]MBV0920963.1 phage tail protein [Limosilactobacillus reuteri]